MWILLKIFVALFAFLARYSTKSFQTWGTEEKNHNGESYLEKIKRTKNSVASTSFGFPSKGKTLFKITKESFWDRMAKTIGLAVEFQTGDRHFDEHYYLACDSEGLQKAIQEDVGIRDLVHGLFQAGCQSIAGDGTHLWVKFPYDRSDDQDAINRSMEFNRSFNELRSKITRKFFDPFAAKALMIEAIVWSIAGYAWFAYPQFFIFREDVHLAQYPIMRDGLLAGVLLALSLVSIIVFFLRGSSRGHRIIVESIFLLALSIPVSGIQLVTDINTNLDRSEPWIVRSKIERVYEQEHRGRRGRRYYTYHMDIQPVAHDKVDVPLSIQVSSSDYRKLQQAGMVEIEIGQGRLKHPWFKAIRPILE